MNVQTMIRLELFLVKALIVYDSLFGNTKQIADAISGVLNAECVKGDVVTAEHLDDVSFLVIGSPTHGGQYTEAIKAFFEGYPNDLFKGLKAVAFDTRTSTHILRFRVENIFGFAANKIAKTLTKKGAILVADPEGFIVNGRKGPLKEGELERAINWIQTLI